MCPANVKGAAALVVTRVVPIVVDKTVVVGTDVGVVVVVPALQLEMADTTVNALQRLHPWLMGPVGEHWLTLHWATLTPIWSPIHDRQEPASPAYKVTQNALFESSW